MTFPKLEAGATFVPGADADPKAVARRVHLC